MDTWRTVLELDEKRAVIGGSERALREAVGRGADLRIYTEFYYHEHIRPGSANRELMKEVSDFRTTYLVDGRWAAGIMTLRMPIDPPAGFGPRPSMSLFLYNQDGSQAIARPFLDGRPAVPLRYGSRGWDFGWLLVRTDGFVARWLCDPYTLRFAQSEAHCALRWFVR